METEHTERRKSRRYTFRSTMEYALISKPGAITTCFTTNISTADSGFCIYTSSPLSKDQKILVRESRLPFQCRSANVRWARRINKKLYVAGLKCVSPDISSLI